MMQSALSRAAQARCFCNCPTCASVSGPVTRRATAPSARRRLIRPDVFTVLSSTLALSATMMDSARKDVKIRQWDEVIERTRAEIISTEEDQNRRLSSLNAPAPLVENDIPDDEVSWGLNFRSKNFRSKDFRSKIEMLMKFERQQERDRHTAGLDNWRGFRLDFLKSLSNEQLLQILQRKSILRRFYGGSDCENIAPEAPGQRLTSKKIRMQEWSMMRLALQFLEPLHAKAEQNRTPPDTLQIVAHLLPLEGEGFQEAMKDTKRKIAELHPARWHDSLPCPQSPHYLFSPSEQECELRQFNVKLQRMLWETSSTLSRRLPSICNYLLSSHIAPNIHTYNLLLIRFCQLREDNCAQAVLQSIARTHVRPNEITHATILRYLTVMNDRHKFKDYVLKMHGLRRGLALANPAREIDPLARSRYHVFGRKSDRIAVKACMNEEVYTSLIVGILKMFSTDEAIFYYSEMVCEGWKPTMEILTAMLQKSCEMSCEPRDFNAGHEFWKKLIALRQMGHKITKTAYTAMLQLCKKCGKTDWYRQVASEAIACGVLPQSISEEPKASRTSIKSKGARTPASFLEKWPTLKSLREQYPLIPGTVLRALLAQSPTVALLSKALSRSNQEYVDLQRLRQATIESTSALSLLSSDISSTVLKVGEAIELKNPKIILHSLLAAHQELEQMSEVDQAFMKYKSSLKKKSGPDRGLPFSHQSPAATLSSTVSPF